MDENTVFQGKKISDSGPIQPPPQPPPPVPMEEAGGAAYPVEAQVVRPVEAADQPPPPQQQQPEPTTSHVAFQPMWTDQGGSPPPPPPSHLEESEDSPRGLISKLIKIIVGILIIVAIGFVIVQFVLPRFASQKNEKVTLTYWGLWETENVMRVIIADFEKQYPNISVSYTRQDAKQYKERLVTRIQGGTGPDIFRFHNTWTPTLTNILLPLPNDIISREDLQKWFYPVVGRDVVQNGAIYGLPLEIDTLALFINTDIFTAAGVPPPKSWEEFITLARKLTVKEESGKIKTAGAAMGTFDNITHAPDIISLLFVQNGADVRNLAETSQNAQDALSFYTSFATGGGNVWDTTLDPSLLAFSKGNLAMYFGYSWDIFAIKAANPTLAFQIFPVPHLPQRNTTIASYWVEGVSAKSKYQKEAFLFMQFLSRRETEQKLYTESSKTRFFGEPYARVDLADTLKDNPLVYPFVQQAKDASSSFFASDTYDNGLNAQMNGYLGNTVRSILGNTSPQTAVQTLSQGVSQVLKQHGQ